MALDEISIILKNVLNTSMENDFRRWIRLMEAATSDHVVRVFHGSPDSKMRLRNEPLYGVRDFGFAASYALSRHTHIKQATVFTLDFHFKNLCDEKSLLELFKKHNIETSTSAAGVFIDNPEFMDVLIEAGYDGLTAHDFGFRNDFEELPVWMVVNSVKQVKIIDATRVTRDDLKRKHEPS